MKNFCYNKPLATFNNPISGILSSIIEFKVAKEEIKKDFVVLINDYGTFYTKALLDIIRKNYKNGVDENLANRLENGDYLFFIKDTVKVYDGKGGSSIPYTDGLRVYCLSSEFSTIKGLIEKNNKTKCEFCPFSMFNKRKSNNRIYDGDVINVEEKVSIFSNFVKIGYDTYPIFGETPIFPFFDEEYVSIEGEMYKVVRQLFDKAYLERV